MTRGRKILIGVGVVIVIGAALAVTARSSRDRGVEVRMETVARRDLVATVTASGNIRARRTVDISADVSGRVVELNVEEGDDVTRGQVLLRIDPTQFSAALARARGGLSQAESQATQQRANFVQAEREYNRIRSLWDRDSTLVSRRQVDDAETSVEVGRSLFSAAESVVAQARATLAESEDLLAKTIIRAPITGKVTRLNIELGETAIIGTMNNPGSLLLTLSDLSVVEAVMEVDETDVPQIALGDSALVDLDAFPGVRFTGRVTEIGNSAIRPPSASAGTGQTPTIDFEVVITLDSPSVELRPDLSATADIITDTRSRVLSVPIIALTVRDQPAPAAARDTTDQGQTRRPEGPLARSMATEPEEGVFVVRDGAVVFTPVEIGVAGQEYFEVVSGLQEGDTVVSGPYQRIRQLADGDRVRAEEQPDEPERTAGGRET